MTEEPISELARMLAKVREVAARVAPYLPDLPPPEEIGVYEEDAWEGMDERILGFARHSERKVAVRSRLEGEALELVIAHELLHLAAPDLPEEWVGVLDRILLHAVREGYPPRDLASLADASMEELLGRAGELPAGADAGLEGYESPYLPLYLSLGVLPDPGMMERPVYLFQQIAGDLLSTDWLLRRLWASPPLTKREAKRRIRRRIASMTEEELGDLEALLGRDLFPRKPLELVGWPPVPPERGGLLLALLDAVEGEGEAWEPKEEGDPYEVIAGWLVR